MLTSHVGQLDGKGVELLVVAHHILRRPLQLGDLADRDRPELAVLLGRLPRRVRHHQRLARVPRSTKSSLDGELHEARDAELGLQAGRGVTGRERWEGR